MEIDNLENKNVFVLGGAGFIGSAIVRHLLDHQANVIVFDNFLAGSLGNLEEVKDRIKVINGDIRDVKLKDLFAEEKADYVINLAAEPYIPDCYERPTDFFEVNANGALNVYMACIANNIKRLVQYSTSEVYGTGKTCPMDEHHVVFPQSTYAVSKLAADRLGFTLFHEKKLPVVILRQFNCYGPRETHPYIIPELINQLNKSNKLKLGNLTATRDFTYVDDAAEACIQLLRSPKAEGQVFNVGHGRDVSVKDLAETIGKLMGHENVEINVEQARLRPLDVEKLEANWYKIHKFTGWKPKTDFITGLKKTIEDYRKAGDRWPWAKYDLVVQELAQYD